MSVSVQVRGGHQLARVARQLRQAGRHDLVREMARGLRRAAVPLTDAVRVEAADAMPSGYAPVLLADLQFKTSVHTSPGRAGLFVRASAPTGGGEREVADLNRGVLAHPLFGDRKSWFRQKVEAGFFTRPMRAGAAVVRPQLEQAIEDTLQRAVRG